MSDEQLGTKVDTNQTTQCEVDEDNGVTLTLTVVVKFQAPDESNFVDYAKGSQRLADLEFGLDVGHKMAHIWLHPDEAKP